MSWLLTASDLLRWVGAGAPGAMLVSGTNRRSPTLARHQKRDGDEVRARAFDSRRLDFDLPRHTLREIDLAAPPSELLP